MNTMTCWYLVCCNARQKDAAVYGLGEQGYKVYLPKLMTRRRRFRGMAKVIELLSPRYLYRRAQRSRPLDRAFADIEGVFVARSGLNRVNFLLELLSRQASAEITIEELQIKSSIWIATPIYDC